ncbi:MAG: phage portal protein [Lactobacillales bacterium]|jgi:lambda family phage portal protein|nr:phage portal protein [Lactobacillales bacterium]
MSDTSHTSASRFLRELASWQPGNGSPDSDLLPELSTIVARSRDLSRNHGVASGAIQTLSDNIVGVGFRLSSKPDYKMLGKSKEWEEEWQQKVEGLWQTWANTFECDAAKSLNFNGMTTQVFKSCLINGEALALPLWLPDRRFATTIQLIEPDRLSNPKGAPDNDTLRGGIEIDGYGASVAYHIRKKHPGDFWAGTASEEWERVSAMTPFGRRRVIHVHDIDRIGQSRGKPVLSAIMPMFKMLDHYERSELQAAIVNAMIAAFIETPMDGESLNELFGGDGDDYLKHKKDWKVKLEGGSIIPIFPGDKIAPFTPSRPNSAYGSFIENVLRHIGTGLNIPYELLLKDFSKTNYSSARAALLEAWRYFNGRRAWLAAYWATPIFELWLEEAVNKGLIDAPDFYENKYSYARCKWIGPGRGWIDPVKEAEACRIRMEIGLSTLEEECASQGLDWEEVLEQRAREQSKIKSLGLNIGEKNEM